MPEIFVNEKYKKRGTASREHFARRRRRSQDSGDKNTWTALDDTEEGAKSKPITRTRRSKRKADDLLLGDEQDFTFQQDETRGAPSKTRASSKTRGASKTRGGGAPKRQTKTSSASLKKRSKGNDDFMAGNPAATGKMTKSPKFDAWRKKHSKTKANTDSSAVDEMDVIDGATDTNNAESEERENKEILEAVSANEKEAAVDDTVLETNDCATDSTSPKSHSKKDTAMSTDTSNTESQLDKKTKTTKGASANKPGGGHATEPVKKGHDLSVAAKTRNTKNLRITEDGCFRPLRTPKKKTDGSYVRPRGKPSPGLEWDPVRGLYVPKSKVNDATASSQSNAQTSPKTTGREKNLSPETLESTSEKTASGISTLTQTSAISKTEAVQQRKKAAKAKKSATAPVANKETDAVAKRGSLDTAGIITNNKMSPRAGEDTPLVSEATSAFPITPPEGEQRRNSSKVEEVECTPEWTKPEKLENSRDETESQTSETRARENEVMDILASHFNESNSPLRLGTTFVGGESGGSSKTDVVGKKAAVAREEIGEALVERPHDLAFESTSENKVTDRLSSHCNESNSPLRLGTTFVGGESGGSSKTDVVGKKAAVAREEIGEALVERPHDLAFESTSENKVTDRLTSHCNESNSPLRLGTTFVGGESGGSSKTDVVGKKAAVAGEEIGEALVERPHDLAFESTSENKVTDRLASHCNESNSPRLLGAAVAGGESGGSSKTNVVGKKAAVAREKIGEALVERPHDLAFECISENEVTDRLASHCNESNSPHLLGAAVAGGESGGSSKTDIVGKKVAVTREKIGGALVERPHDLAFESTSENKVTDRRASHRNESNDPHLPGATVAEGESGGSLETDVVGKKATVARGEIGEASVEHPRDLAFKSPTQDISTTVSPDSLLQIAQNGGPVTKKHFFEVSSHSPVQEIDMIECTATRPFQGQIGSGPLQWSQIVRGAGKHLLLTFKDGVNNTDDGDTTDEGRHYLEWEANVLTWLRAWCKDNGKEPESFPNPIWRQCIMKKDSHVLWLNLTSERDSSIEFDVMGTLEDIMHMHARFNIGPLPESISAHIISQVLQCVGTLHRAGVTHNDLGLDSFLLVRRKLGGEQEWYLVCTGLGAKAIVCKDPVGKRGDKNRKRWPFNRDLYGVANIAHLLLSGGSPLAWKRDVSGSIALQSTHAYSSIFMRGKLTWECLFQTLLNPMDETSSLDLAESGKWGEKMLSAINMLRTVSGRSEQNGARNKGFFNELMEHIRHKQVASFSIRPNERFPVKLIVRSRDERQGHTVSKTSIIALERNISRLASLKEDLELNLQNEHKAKESLREETKAARKEAEVARKELTKAVSHSQDLNEELQGLRLKHDALKRKALKHEQGFKRTIAEQTRAISTLRNRLQQGQVALTAEIKATNANLNSRLRELEKELQMREHEKMVLSAQLESAKCTLRIRDQEKANQTGHLDASISQLELDLSESTRLMEGQTNYYGQEKHLLDEGVSELRNQLQDSTEKQKTSVAQGELDPLEILRNFREDKLNWGEDRQYEMEENGTRTEEEATKGEQEARGTGNERKRHRDPRDEAADVQPPVETIVIANQMSISANKKKRLSLPSKSKAPSASCGDSPRPNMSSSTSTRQRLMSTVNRQCDVPKPSLAVAAPAPTQRPREIQKSSNKTDFQNFNKGNSE